MIDLKNNKIKIGVLMGGRSIEKEVSFNSGRTICDHLDINKYDIIPIFQNENGLLFILPWYFLYRGKISDFEFRLQKESKEINWHELKKTVDFIYLAVHGRYCEDGSIQGMLEFLNIPYSGSSFYTGSITSNKFLTNQILKNNNIKTPRNFLIKNYENDLINAISFAKEVNFPIISKPNDEGSSFGVSISNNEDELIKNIDIAKNINRYKLNNVLIEELIFGIEFSCICIQNNNEWIAFEPTEIAHKNNNYVFEYNHKYMPGEGEKHTPMRCSKEQIENVKNTCLKIAKIFEAKDIIRIDGFIDKNNEIIIIDCNIFPGTAPSSFTFIQASLYGMSNSDLINHIVFNSLKRYKRFENFIHLNENCLFNENEDKKLKIGVLFGGNNNEKEISLDSGRNIVYKLSSNKYKITPIFLTNKNEENENKFYKLTNNQLVKNSTNEIIETLNKESEILISDFNNLFDFIFIGLHGGQGENGCLQGVLETLNIPYNGSGISTSAICMDKYKTYKMLEKNFIHIPNHFLISRESSLSEIEDNYEKISKKNTIPIIIKPHNDGCSFMVTISNSFEECINNINLILKENEFCLMEECINCMELTVGVIGNKDYIVMPPSYTPKVKDILSLEEKFLPGAGENITPAPLSNEDMMFVKDEIKKVAEILNISGYCRIDCFFQKENKENNFEKKLIILECNTLPALTPATCIFHQASEIGIRPFEFLNKIIELGLEK